MSLNLGNMDPARAAGGNTTAQAYGELWSINFSDTYDMEGAAANGGSGDYWNNIQATFTSLTTILDSSENDLGVEIQNKVTTVNTFNSFDDGSNTMLSSDVSLNSTVNDGYIEFQGLPAGDYDIYVYGHELGCQIRLNGTTTDCTQASPDYVDGTFPAGYVEGRNYVKPSCTFAASDVLRLIIRDNNVIGTDNPKISGIQLVKTA